MIYTLDLSSEFAVPQPVPEISEDGGPPLPWTTVSEGPRPPGNLREDSIFALCLPFVSKIRSRLSCRSTPKLRIGGWAFKKNLFFYWSRYFPPKILLVN